MDEFLPRSYPAAKTTFQAPTLRVCAWITQLSIRNFVLAERLPLHTSLAKFLVLNFALSDRLHRQLHHNASMAVSMIQRRSCTARIHCTSSPSTSLSAASRTRSTIITSASHFQ